MTIVLCLSWRSGDEVSDAGHMTVPSMEQAMCSSTIVMASSALDRSGKVHIDPITWQKVKRSSSATYFVSTRRIMRATNLLRICSNASIVSNNHNRSSSLPNFV